jgi:hypothetical protein
MNKTLAAMESRGGGHHERNTRGDPKGTLENLTGFKTLDPAAER